MIRSIDHIRRSRVEAHYGLLCGKVEEAAIVKAQRI